MWLLASCRLGNCSCWLRYGRMMTDGGVMAPSALTLVTVFLALCHSGGGQATQGIR